MGQASKWQRLSLRTQMLLAVNIVLALAALVLIVMEGQRDGAMEWRRSSTRCNKGLIPSCRRSNGLPGRGLP